MGILHGIYALGAAEACVGAQLKVRPSLFIFISSDFPLPLYLTSPSISSIYNVSLARDAASLTSKISPTQYIDYLDLTQTVLLLFLQGQAPWASETLVNPIQGFSEYAE
jgi:hypothetical protein